MTRYDGMAFEAPEIKETQHGDMPCTDRATAQESAIDWQEPETPSAMLTPRSPNVPTPDTSFAAFLIEPEPGE